MELAHRAPLIFIDMKKQLPIAIVALGLAQLLQLSRLLPQLDPARYLIHHVVDDNNITTAIVQTDILSSSNHAAQTTTAAVHPINSPPIHNKVTRKQQQQQPLPPPHANKLGTLYVCGYGPPEPMARIFPQHNYVPLTKNSTILLRPNSTTTTTTTGQRPHDIFLSLGKGRGGCRPRDVLASPAAYREFLRTKFRGSILLVNPESDGSGAFPQPIPSNMIHAGYYADDDISSNNRTSLRVPWMVWTLLWLDDTDRQRLFFHNHHPHKQKDRTSGRRPHFLVYAASNCVDFRERAVDRLAGLGRVHIAGNCAGLVDHHPNKTKLNDFPKEKGRTAASLWVQNPRLFRRYRFCLVMEHSAVDGYITEKIVMAFLGGCIPIYYGA